MNGEATLSCDGSGEWDHEMPTCSRKTCPWRQPEFSRRYNYDVEWPGKDYEGYCVNQDSHSVSPHKGETRLISLDVNPRNDT